MEYYKENLNFTQDSMSKWILEKLHEPLKEFSEEEEILDLKTASKYVIDILSMLSEGFIMNFSLENY